MGASKLKVNTVVAQCSSTITLGKCGGTVALGCGASQSGLGGTGTVDWCTTAKTTPFTAVNGKGYFINTVDGSPFLNYTVTVATGALYLVGGTGSAYFLDASRTTAINLIKDRTYRFTQSEGTNDSHPLIISTSNSTTLGTFQAGIVSTGISYYLDGASTQSDYVNTTTFNAATTRYIEFKPATSGTFYFGCYIHGIGMGGAITTANYTVTLPSSPSANDIVAFKDYGNNFNTNSVQVSRNGSKINGQCHCATLSTQSQSVTLIYVDGTKGWQDINDSQVPALGATFVAATGGNTTTTSGDFKIHTFTGSGTFCVSAAGNALGSNTVSYVVIGGGAGGGGSCRASGGYGAGGGGAGGYREGKAVSDTYCASPLATTGLAVATSPGSYPVTIGGGGTGGAESTPGTAGQGGDGVTSVFSTISSAGGGGGGAFDNSPGPVNIGRAGGSGGGAGAGGHPTGTPYAGGAGNTPPVSPPQGNPGATMPGSNQQGTGGGGALTAGNSSPACLPCATGGTGATSTINATPTARAGGGGGHRGAGGAGGGGAGGQSPGTAVAGTANTGGGGGGAGYFVGQACGAAGGSGIVIIRYKFQ